MDQENQQNFYSDPAGTPVRRKRGRPRKDDVPVSELSLRTQQRRRADSPGRGLVGQAVSGILDGTFEAGYLLTVRVGGSGPVYKGMVFDPRLCSPISAENDIAPNLPMISRNDMAPLMLADVPTEAAVPTANQPLQQNNRSSFQPFQRNEAAAIPIPVHPVRQNVPAVLQRSEPASARTPVQILPQNVRAIQPLQRNDSAQPVQQNTRVQFLTRNEAAAVLTPTQPEQQNIRAFQFLQKNESSSVPAPVQPAQQYVIAVKHHQRNEPGIVQQNFGTVQTFQRSESIAVPTDHSAQKIARGINHPQRNEPATYPAPAQPVQHSVPALLTLPRNDPVILSQLPPAPSSLNVEKVVLTDSRLPLQSDSKPKAAIISSPNASAIPESQQSEVQNAPTVTPVCPPFVVVKEEEAPLTIEAEGHQLGEGSKALKENIDPRKNEDPSGEASRISNSAQIGNDNLTGSEMPGSTSERPQPQAVEKCTTEAQDSAQPDSSMAAAPSVSAPETDHMVA